MLFSSHKILKLIAGIFIFFIITYLCFDLIFNFSSNLSIFIQKLSANIYGALFIYGVLLIDVIMPVPSSLIMVSSGILFKGFLGGIIAISGSLSCSILAFLLSRKLGRTRVEKWLGEEEFNKLSNFLSKKGRYLIILSRSVPLVMESVSCISGLSKIRLRTYIILNILGYAPLTFMYSYAGAFYGTEKPINIFIILALGFFVPVIIWFLILKLVKFKK